MLRSVELIKIEVDELSSTLSVVRCMIIVLSTTYSELAKLCVVCCVKCISQCGEI